ncbi:MAG TPA: DNA repair protein RecN, partial [Pyrinomonadaceae bacterium]|nr:DNA repair protein RecN [Pyrinomonadaceae bacterium]
MRFLSITNFAVIQRLRIDLHAGLNLLTGETGAGKSIIVDALGLLLGGRSTAGVVRTGERAAWVEGGFELTGEGGEHVGSILAEVGITKEAEEELWIRREVQAAGRTRIFVNDQSVTAATLRRLQPYLVEVHGQGEQQSLTSPRAQLEMLDAFAGCEELRAELSRAYARWRAAVDALRSLERDEAARERAADMLRFQIEEIEKADPRAGEDEELSAERTLLAHAEKALELGSGAYASLYESDASVLAQLANVRRRLQDLSAIDVRAASWLETLETAEVSLSDVAEALRGYGAEMDFSPDRLGEIENRLAELERLKRKYGRDLSGLLEVREELRGHLEGLGNLAERERELLDEAERAARAYAPLAARLSEERRAAAPRLEHLVTEELRQVALERARFVVKLETAVGGQGGDWLQSDAKGGATPEGEKSQPSFWSPYGADALEFQFSANVGEAVRPLARVASGGELSRLMLTLRTVCRGDARGGDAFVGTLVFDEIDAGIGGRAAEAVGRRLKSLAATQQVLCVTHQPQIARFADHHYVVSKEVSGERTVTHVRELDAEERVGELARMIGGAEEVETTRAAARWMLENTENGAATSPEASDNADV